ncbi:NAD(P)-binding protein [Viridothelium virens]|uniref:NAD(P)-binding protein n=1 Tax=Viridothelium virens TaxID=1048519 RepID=A0A6A6HDQ7_VIRVR|nr:NAD(P)-binding protein [Viridothelium virens]
MATKQSVLLLGATGETGRAVVNALIKDGSFDIKLLVRKASLEKPAVKEFEKQGLEIRVGNPADGAEALVPIMKDVHTVISTIDALSQSTQLPLVQAAKQAGVKRFVPCAFITVCPPGGIMWIRDEKETVYQEIWRARLPYTIIDCGFWHQVTFPSLPSGRTAYAQMMPENTMPGDGNTPTLLTDLRDVGTYVARIIKDERTLNKFVVTYSDELSENEIFDIMEEVSGEKIERKYEILAKLEAASKAVDKDPGDVGSRFQMAIHQYNYSKFIRGDNTLEMAKYLGYLDVKELYPDFKPITFKEFAKELLDGKIARPYEGRF